MKVVVVVFTLFAIVLFFAATWSALAGGERAGMAFGMWMASGVLTIVAGVMYELDAMDRRGGARDRGTEREAAVIDSDGE